MLQVKIITAYIASSRFVVDVYYIWVLYKTTPIQSVHCCIQDPECSRITKFVLFSVRTRTAQVPAPGKLGPMFIEMYYTMPKGSAQDPRASIHEANSLGPLYVLPAVACDIETRAIRMYAFILQPSILGPLFFPFFCIPALMSWPVKVGFGSLCCCFLLL